MSRIQSHVTRVTARLYDKLKAIWHSSGSSLVVVEGDHENGNPDLQCGAIAFNVERRNRSFFRYSTVVSESACGAGRLPLQSERVL
jgi:hypothetical protein